jgi:hypothetical protein
MDKGDVSRNRESYTRRLGSCSRCDRFPFSGSLELSTLRNNAIMHRQHQPSSIVRTSLR